MKQRMARLAVVAAVAGFVCPAARAQVLQRPERPAPPADSSRTQHTLTLTSNLLAAHGQGLEKYGVPIESGTPATYSGFGDARLRYEAAEAGHSLELAGRAYGTSFTSPAVRPLWGGDAEMSARTRVGRRGQIEVSAQGSSDPFVTLGAFAPLPPGADQAVTPDASPAHGLFTSRAWSASGGASFRSQWSRRGALTGGYRYDKRQYASRAGFDNTSQQGSLGLEHTLSRSLAVVATYRYSDLHTDVGTGGTLPLRQHTVETGLHYDAPLSRTAQLSLAADGGATYATLTDVTGTPRQDWLWAAHGSAAVPVGRSWVLQADYRHALTVLAGVSPRPYATSTASLSVGGLVGPRADVVMSGSFVTGSAGLTGNSNERYDNYIATAQVRYAMAEWCGAVVTYSYYRHQFLGVTDLPVSIPLQLDRNTVQAGLTFWVPLHRSRTVRGGVVPEGGN